MKSIRTTITAIAFLPLLHACTSRGEPVPYDKSFESGAVAVKLRGGASGYNWDFKRNISRQLKLHQRKELDDLNLISLGMKGNTLMGLNWRASKIYFLNDSLDVSSSWGAKGKEPGENENILSYQCSGNDLYLYDFEQKALKKYGLQKSGYGLESYFDLKQQYAVYDACHLSGNKYLYLNPSDSAKGFDFIVMDSGRTLNRLPVLPAANLNSSIAYPQMVYDGDFVSSDDSRYTAYYCRFAGVFFWFDKQDLSRFSTASTIDHTPPPVAHNVEIAPKTFKLEVRPNIEFFTSAAIQGNGLYLLNAINLKHEFILDVYDLSQQGRYDHSIYVPSSSNVHPLSIVVRDAWCYILYSNQSIARFSIEPLQPSSTI